MKRVFLILIIGVLLMPTVFISAETQATFKAELNQNVPKYAARWGLEAALIYAIINSESGGYKYAFRNDRSVLQGQKWVQDAISAGNLLEIYGPSIYCSAGYMQILYIVAIAEYGFKGTIEQFMQIENQLEYGCRHLAALKKRYGNRVKDMISAYNQGWDGYRDLDHDGVQDPNEPYYNQDYVNQAYDTYKRLGGLQ